MAEKPNVWIKIYRELRQSGYSPESFRRFLVEDCRVESPPSLEMLQVAEQIYGESSSPSTPAPSLISSPSFPRPLSTAPSSTASSSSPSPLSTSSSSSFYSPYTSSSQRAYSPMVVSLPTPAKIASKLPRQTTALVLDMSRETNAQSRDEENEATSRSSSDEEEPEREQNPPGIIDTDYHSNVDEDAAAPRETGPAGNTRSKRWCMESLAKLRPPKRLLRSSPDSATSVPQELSFESFCTHKGPRPDTKRSSYFEIVEKTRFKEANYEAFAQCMPMYVMQYNGSQKYCQLVNMHQGWNGGSRYMPDTWSKKDIQYVTLYADKKNDKVETAVAELVGGNKPALREYIKKLKEATEGRLCIDSDGTTYHHILAKIEKIIRMYARKEKPRTVVAGYTILFVDKVGCALPLPK